MRSVSVKERARDSGASSLEWALLTPVLITMILFVVQFAMIYHARHVALAAAQSGARVARTDTSSAWRAKAERRATDSVAQVGPGLLTNIRAVATGDQRDRQVVVTGRAVAVVPLLDFNVREQAGGPRECFRPDVGGGITCQDQP
ncbi:TadE/TadG family type IV pilus assembly protein [Actinomadura scrupuli]|uniref:TadE/TadG family type IV pilus assembly protein n=1 Tax=Actinomadura scrupuli TaxID=559629 RepID=UPI003D9862B0